ncbi:MAG: four-carbon acid sugar kinase family protein [Clostridia bacterium]|nr:four-carbon acid sugar kinase family protein [Clostridia bacterium]NLS85960.1 four-carbon acid sugar kinase family protein [Oscillospiraceae bacterium]
MIRLLIISDDFTGALDTGVQLAASGAVTKVVTDPTADLKSVGAGCEVLVIDAETRHLTPNGAYKVVYEIVGQASKLGVPYIYKKTDSALRGNIGAELTAVLDASGAKQLPFLPAFPQIGRSTVDGVHYIDDVPVAQSVFGTDPFEPVKHSNISLLISEQSDTKVQSFPPLNSHTPLPNESGIQIYDAKTLDELVLTGKRLLEEGQLHIMAGCAGFGAVLPELLGIGSGTPIARPKLDPWLLVVCGSVNPITAQQLDNAEKNGFVRLRLTPEQKLENGYWETPKGQAEFDAMRRIVEQAPCCILDTNDSEGNKLTADYADEKGMDIDDIRLGASRSIGCLVSRLFSSPALGTLLITGGDTLLQCMDYMGVYEMTPICELEVGVVLSSFCYGGCKRYILSKSGGFGCPELLTNLSKQLSENTHHTGG